jgi:hypothetical protein
MLSNITSVTSNIDVIATAPAIPMELIILFDVEINPKAMDQGIAWSVKAIV